jgi:hypothetical protein
LNMTSAQRIAVKRTVERDKAPIEQVLASMGLAPMPTQSRIAAAKEAARLDQVDASAEMVAKVEPHAKAIEALADRLHAAGIGQANPGGHVLHFKRIASEMRASAAAGRLPHTVGYDPAVGHVMGSSVDRIAASSAPTTSPVADRVAAALSGLGLSPAARKALAGLR